MRGVTRRPLLVLALTAVLALGGAALALRLEPSAATSTLVDPGSESYRANERFKQDFGDDAVLVMVQGELSRTVLTEDLSRVLALEGCLSGNAPERGLKELPAVCRELAALKPAKAVYGPGTFINTAAVQIADQFTARQRASGAQADRAARAARRLSARRGDPPAEQRRLAAAARQAVEAQFIQQVLQLGLRYGLTDIPRINDPNFVSTLVFDSDALQAGTPKSRFAYLFPSRNAALIQIRMRPGLSESERTRAIALIEEAAAQKAFRPREGARYIVTGVPVVTEGLADAVQDSIFVLLAAAVLLMGATLALVFRSRLRLLPLALALAAAAMTFGGLSLLGGDLTMASIAVLPVLIGLAVDYAIQFQARFDEAQAGGRTGAGRGGRGGRRAHDPHGGCGHGGGLPRVAALTRAHGARLRGADRGGDRARPGVRGVCRLRGPDPLSRRSGAPASGPGPRGAPAQSGLRVAGQPRLAHPGRGARPSPARAGGGAGGGRGGNRSRHPERGGLGRP